MFHRLSVLAVLLMAFAGCNKQPAKKVAEKPFAERPSALKPFVEVPATPPKFEMVAFRPRFSFRDGSTQSAGTAFVIRAKDGERYLLTAAHLFEPKEWNTLTGVSLFDFKGKEQLGQSSKDNPITYIGKGFDPNRNESEFDLAIFKLAPESKATPLKLAAEYPNQNRLWLVGSEVSSRDGVQRQFELNPASLIEGKNTVILKKAEPVQLQAFSGGPIVDHNGLVVATLLGGNANSVVGTTVASLRRRLEEKGITPE